MDSTRVDRWLVAVRLYKTRQDAADACGGGKVRLNGRTLKPSTPVHTGDRIEVRINQRERIVEVVKIIDKRVGASIARECYIDHSPPPEPYLRQPPPMRRDPGSGRPTKRDRRKLDDLRRG